MRILILALAFLLLGCSGSETPENQAATSTTSCVDQWAEYVAEWNELTEQRDAEGADAVTVDGETFETYDDFASANGYPLTYDQLCS